MIKVYRTLAGVGLTVREEVDVRRTKAKQIVKRFKTCMGCPFLSPWSRCGAPGGRLDVMLDTRARARPPEWCPLRRGPITIELVTEERAEAREESDR